MDKKDVIKALNKAKENSPKRKFKQTFDLIVTFKGLDLKKPEHKLNTFLALHYSNGKKVSVGALVGPELYEDAKKICDEAVLVDEFKKYASDKKLVKKLGARHDFFIAQATIMPKVASTFGRVFGPKGKMPNPKAGCVVPPNANLEPLYKRLQNTIRLQTVNQPVIQCAVGKEDSKEEEIVDNVMTIYNSLIHTLPNTHHNIKDIFVKLTMGHPVKVGEKVEEEEPNKGKQVEEDKPEDKDSKSEESKENSKGKQEETKENKKESKEEKEDKKEDKKEEKESKEEDNKKAKKEDKKEEKESKEDKKEEKDSENQDNK